MAAQRGSAATAVARREHTSAELDQKPMARQQGAELRDGNHSPSNGEVLEPTPAAMVLQPSMSSRGASPAGDSINSSAEPVTPLAFPAQQQQTQQPSLVVFSGGTAFNTVAGWRHAQCCRDHWSGPPAKLQALTLLHCHMLCLHIGKVRMRRAHEDADHACDACAAGQRRRRQHR